MLLIPCETTNHCNFHLVFKIYLFQSSYCPQIEIEIYFASDGLQGLNSTPMIEESISSLLEISIRQDTIFHIKYVLADGLHLYVKGKSIEQNGLAKYHFNTRLKELNVILNHWNHCLYKFFPDLKIAIKTKQLDAHLKAL